MLYSEGVSIDYSFLEVTSIKHLLHHLRQPLLGEGTEVKYRAEGVDVGDVVRVCEEEEDVGLVIPSKDGIPVECVYMHVKIPS